MLFDTLKGADLEGNRPCRHSCKWMIHVMVIATA